MPENKTNKHLIGLFKQHFCGIFNVSQEYAVGLDFETILLNLQGLIEKEKQLGQIDVLKNQLDALRDFVGQMDSAMEEIQILSLQHAFENLTISEKVHS